LFAVKLTFFFLFAPPLFFRHFFETRSTSLLAYSNNCFKTR
jgi:hypothetical protein